MKKAKREVTVMYPGGYVLCPGECYGTCEVLKEFLKIKEREARMKEYIEREALIARYDAEHVGPPGRAGELMVTAPAADVAEVKHAYWNDDGRCSNCDWYMPFDCEGNAFETFFCPNCGAKMDKEE